MDKQAPLYKVLHFFLTKIVIGITVIVGLVALSESLGSLLPDKTQLSDDSKSIIIAISDVTLALAGYILLFRTYEKRQIKELSFNTLGKEAVIGFATGLVLQSLFVLVIYITASYVVTNINPVSFLIFPFATALRAGFIAEILILGIFFRLTEERLGTVITLIIITLLFSILHVSAEHATFLSVCSTAVQAGFMLSAAYIFNRSLWLPIFLHFSWDFAEPGIYGGINPGNSIPQSLLTSKISGSVLLTGGLTGPQNSIEALIISSITGILFLWLAKQKNNFIKPYWKRQLP